MIPFPDPGRAFPEFEAPPEWTPQRFADWDTWYRGRYDHHLIYWNQLAPLYVQALQQKSGGDDEFDLQASCTEWPSNRGTQQQVLTQLLDDGPLRRAWRSYIHWQQTQADWHMVAQQDTRDILEARLEASSRPLREIPLYQGDFRLSCQQIVCLPERQWHALIAKESHYDPNNINTQVVDALVRRIARAFNEPVPEPGAVPHGWHEVWPANARTLTTSRDAHGMEDRLFDEYLRPIEHAAGQVPTLRFGGYFGRIILTGIDAEPWIVAVLAPGHFLAHLTRLIRQTYDHTDPTLSQPP